jgi:hypothetical protein
MKTYIPFKEGDNWKLKEENPILNPFIEHSWDDFENWPDKTHDNCDGLEWAKLFNKFETEAIANARILINHVEGKDRYEESELKPVWRYYNDVYKHENGNIGQWFTLLSEPVGSQFKYELVWQYIGNHEKVIEVTSGKDFLDKIVSEKSDFHDIIHIEGKSEDYISISYAYQAVQAEQQRILSLISERKAVFNKLNIPESSPIIDELTFFETKIQEP